MVKNNSTISTKQKLSFFWIFAIVNYIFCDVFTLFHSESLALEQKTWLFRLFTFR